jgi:hypothetical protein
MKNKIKIIIIEITKETPRPPRRVEKYADK